MKKNRLPILLFLSFTVFIFMTGNVFAQLTGTKTIPGDYTTVAAAITDLNTVGVGSGGVTFNVAAGYTETAANLIITATGTSSNQIIFQKSGSGANPLITAGVGVSTTLDGIIILSGADYITFNGIDLQENVANTTTTTQMEFGYALLKVDGTNGSQSNTIKNCVITLNKTNTSTKGIHVANHTPASTTSLTVTAFSGTNSNNMINGNILQNCYIGINVAGYADAVVPYAFYDHYNQIGYEVGNIIRLFGGSTATAYGIYTIYQDSLGVCNNNIAGGTGTTTTLYGIMISTATNASVLVYNNTVSDTTSTTTSSTYGIALNNAGYTGTDNTVIVKRNTVQGMTSLAATSASLYGYYIYYTTAVNIYVDSNKFINNKWGGATQTTTGTIYGFYIYPYTTAPVSGSVQYVTNNYMSGNKRTQSALSSGTLYGMYIYYGNQTVTAYNNIIENDTLSSTTSASYYMYVYNYYATTVSYYNNIIRNIYRPNGTGATYGYYISNAAYTGTFNFYNNTANNIKSAATASSIYGIYNLSSAVTKNMYNNTAYSLYTSVGGAVYGMYNSGGTTVNIYKNSVYDLRTGTGFAYGLTSASGTSVNIYNNFVSDMRCDSTSSTLAMMGLYISGGTAVNAYYNTIYLNAVSTGTLFGTVAIYASSTPTVDLRNNIAVNMSTPGPTGGYTTAYYRSSSTLTTYSGLSNNNDFYSGTPDTNHIIYYDGINYMRTLPEYKIFVSPRDANSVTENPPFVNISTTPYNLHINAAIATQCEGSGIVISSPIAVNDDFDGQARYPNAGYPVNPSYPPAAPDLGADEFGGIPLDMVPPLITYTPLLNTPSTSSRILTSTVTDGSGVPTSGIGLPRLFWRINSGLWDSTTSTYIGSNQHQFTFGTGVVTGDTVKYYVVAQDLAVPPNVGTNPSAGAGNFTANPPRAGTPPTTPSSYIISSSPLAGDYTVGLTLFNNLTGYNVYFAKVTTKVTKEVWVEQQAEKKQLGKGETEISETSTLVNPKGRMEVREVEEVSWVPMQNGKVFDGPLYIKKSESPNYSYPLNVNGVYATITAAIGDLNLRGVGGATRFLLNDTSYTTGETFPLIINVANVNKPTVTNTVTIKPNTGVASTIYGAAASSRIFTILNSYVTIDGSNTVNGTTRNLTIQNTSTTTPQVILIGSTGTTPITNVTVKNCNIINGVNSSSAMIISDGTISGTAGWFNNITVQNNSINLAYIGIYSIATISAGNGTGLNISGNDLNNSAAPVRLCKIYVQGVDGATIANNNIGNDSDAVDASNITGIWFATGTVNSSITGNTITNIAGYGPPRGIAISSALPNANINITGNTISGVRTAYSSPPYGIYVFSTTSGVSIKKNKISGLRNYNTGGYGARGINIVTSVTPANIDIINNFVWDVIATSDASVTYWGIGIAVDASVSTINVYANSVNLYGSFAGYSSATIHTAFYVGSGVTLINVRDNIFVNSYDNTTSTTDKSYSIYSAATNAAYTDINYDDYFVSGTPGVLGYLGADKLTLADWRTATGKDVNSISGNPMFFADSNLHIDSNQVSPVGDAGQFIAAVTDDIDGNIRNISTPDIGADEYTMLTPVPAAPQLVSPPNASTGNPLNLNLVWNKPQYATKYHVMLATDAGFANIVVNDSTLTDSVKAVSNLSPLTFYYWKVRAGNTTGWSSFSGTYSFKTMGVPTQVNLFSPANGATNQPVNITFLWYKAVDQTDEVSKGKNNSNNTESVSNYWFELSTSPTFTTVVTRDSLLTDSVKMVNGLSGNTLYYWRVKAKNSVGWGLFSTVWSFTTVALNPSLSIKVYLEGFYSPEPLDNKTGKKSDGKDSPLAQVPDTVRIYLADSLQNYAFVDSAKIFLPSTGQYTTPFTGVTTGKYYIVVKHRNHLETWSKFAVSFTGGSTTSYDFTTAASQAYGDNMKLVGSVWVIYGGDPNQDGDIGALDIPIFISQFGTQGYLSCDFNGDDDVTGVDQQILIQNFGITTAKPGTLLLMGPEKRSGLKDYQDKLKELQVKDIRNNK